MTNPLEKLLRQASLATARILSRALSGKDLDLAECSQLLTAQGSDLDALIATADELRRRQSGDRVSYVVNRNINFTNVCVKRCSFCAFSRTRRSQEGYLLPREEMLSRAREAWQLGATEVCVQAGLLPEMPGDLYIELCQMLKETLPAMHIHAFSPEEVLYGSRCSGRSTGDYLKALRDAGIGSLPGTSAEVLVQAVRDRISPGRITVDQWTEIILQAHELGIPTTSTVMYGHVEKPIHLAHHLLLLRRIQRRTGGFTEFVPLSFVHHEAPMFTDGLIADVRPGANREEVLRMHAVARIALGRDIPNIQVSWVKEGLGRSAECLMAGANDLGGTLINESISTAAGAGHGQLVRPKDLRRLARQVGRVPVERNTLYDPLKVFAGPESDDPGEPLDQLTDGQAARFGSYRELVESSKFRYQPTAGHHS